MSLYINFTPNSFDNFSDYFFYNEEQEQPTETSSTVSLQQQVKEIRQTAENGPVYVIPANWRDRLYRDAGDCYAPFHILINTPKTEEISVDSLRIKAPDEVAKNATLAAQLLKQDVAIEPIAAPKQFALASPPKKELGFLASIFAFLSRLFSCWNPKPVT